MMIPNLKTHYKAIAIKIVCTSERKDEQIRGTKWRAEKQIHTNSINWSVTNK